MGLLPTDDTTNIRFAFVATKYDNYTSLTTWSSSWHNAPLTRRIFFFSNVFQNIAAFAPLCRSSDTADAKIAK
jgi:hypothetical protein